MSSPRSRTSSSLLHRIRTRLRSPFSKQASSSPKTSRPLVSTSSTVEYKPTQRPSTSNTEITIAVTDHVLEAPCTETTHDIVLDLPVKIVSVVANVEPSSPSIGVGSPRPFQDLWSTAFREAIASVGNEIDEAILQAESIESLFRQLEEQSKETSQDTAFKKGVRYLTKLKGPLSSFKVALDWASPFTSLEPTTKLVFGVVSGVTAIAVTLASVDIDFAKQIKEMLEHLEYIDDCDALGEKTQQVNIHKALVQVYCRLLEFYNVTHTMLVSSGARVLLSMALQTSPIADSVEAFVKCADDLHSVIQNASLAIAADIKAMLDDEQIARWLGAEKAVAQQRHHGNQKAWIAEESCDYIVEEEEFKRWYRQPNPRQLIILGDVGFGKSVLSSFLIEELMDRASHRVPRRLTCFHYCRDNATGRIHNIISSLLLSLIHQHEGIKKKFYDWVKHNQACGHVAPASDIIKLGDFFKETLQSLERPLYIVMDGLDECDEKSRHDIMSLLDESCERNENLKVLFTSRPYQDVLLRIRGMACIKLTPNMERDRKVAKHAVQRELPHLDSKVEQLVVDHLSEFACGNRIWIQMATSLINIKKTKALGPMQKLLRNMPLPADLYALYSSILSRTTGDDRENRALAISALKILVTSKRSLDTVELAWAAALATAPKKITTVAELATLVDEERTLELIEPFTCKKTSEFTQQCMLSPIHQSVKEYVQELTRYEPSNIQGGNSATCSSPEFQSLKHASDQKLEEDILVNICMRYLLLEEMDQKPLLSEDQEVQEELLTDGDVFDEFGPQHYNPYCSWEEWEKDMVRFDPADRGFGNFFVYASSHWIDHLGLVENPQLQLQDFEKICTAGTLRLRNWTQQNARPGCALQARFEFNSNLYDPLAVASLYASENMLRRLVQTSNLTEGIFLTRTGLTATEHVLRWGNPSRLRILVAEKRLNLHTMEFWRLVLRHWRSSDQRHDAWNSVFRLIEDTSEALIREEAFEELLCLVAKAGCLPMAMILIDLAHQDPRLKEAIMGGRAALWHPICEAILGNHLEMTRFLSQQEDIKGHLTDTNDDGTNLLHLAAKHCNPDMFRFLLPMLSEKVNEVDGSGYTLLALIRRSPYPTNEHRATCTQMVKEKCSASVENGMENT